VVVALVPVLTFHLSPSLSCSTHACTGRPRPQSHLYLHWSSCPCQSHPHVPHAPCSSSLCGCCALVSVAPHPSPLVFMSVLVHTDCVSLMLMVVPAIIPASFQSRSGPCLHSIHTPCLFPHSVLLACFVRVLARFDSPTCTRLSRSWP